MSTDLDYIAEVLDGVSKKLINLSDGTNNLSHEELSEALKTSATILDLHAQSIKEDLRFERYQASQDPNRKSKVFNWEEFLNQDDKETKKKIDTATEYGEVDAEENKLMSAII